MSYGQRSKQFDWFKNDSQMRKPKKETAKTVWKFLKIFIYLSLFVFSMIGCVQSFMIKTTNYTGRGFELYHSEAAISPHVTELKFAKKQISLNNATNGNASDKLIDVYGVEINIDSNIYVSDKDNKAMLENIHETIKQQNDQKDLKLIDSWKGINEGIRFNSSINDLNSSEKVHKFNENYAVLSSKSGGEDKTDYNLGGPKDFRVIKLWFPNYDKDQKIIGFKQGQLKFYQVDDKGQPTSEISNPDDYNQTKPKNLFRQALINQIFSKDNEFTQFVLKNPQDVSTNLQDQIKFHVTQRAAYGPIISYLGIKDFEIENDQGVFKILDDYMLVAGYGETDYYPIASWGSSWGLGPFYGLFVYPIGKLFTSMLWLMPIIQGWEVLIAIVIIVVISRLITFLLSFKSTLQQTKMQELQAKKAIIDAKYAPYKGNKQMENRQRQEVAELYKKAGINPLGALGTIFVTMPIFLALWRVIGGVQQVKSTIWLGINFSATSYSELFKGSFQYLPLMILAAGTQLFAQIYPRLLTRKKEQHQINVYQKAAMKKNNRTQNIMMGVMVFLALVFSAGIQIYWIIGGLWRIFEVYITHKIIHRHKKSTKSKKTSYSFVTN